MAVLIAHVGDGGCCVGRRRSSSRAMFAARAWHASHAVPEAQAGNGCCAGGWRWRRRGRRRWSPSPSISSSSSIFDGALRGLLRMQHHLQLLLMQQTMAALVVIGVGVGVGHAEERRLRWRPPAFLSFFFSFCCARSRCLACIACFAGSHAGHGRCAHGRQLRR